MVSIRACTHVILRWCILISKETQERKKIRFEHGQTSYIIFLPRECIGMVGRPFVYAYVIFAIRACVFVQGTFPLVKSTFLSCWLKYTRSANSLTRAKISQGPLLWFFGGFTQIYIAVNGQQSEKQWISRGDDDDDINTHALRYRYSCARTCVSFIYKEANSDIHIAFILLHRIYIYKCS